MHHMLQLAAACALHRAGGRISEQYASDQHHNTLNIWHEQGGWIAWRAKTRPRASSGARQACTRPRPRCEARPEAAVPVHQPARGAANVVGGRWMHNVVGGCTMWWDAPCHLVLYSKSECKYTQHRNLAGLGPGPGWPSPPCLPLLLLPYAPLCLLISRKSAQGWG